MRLYTLLFITVFVLGTKAASIPSELVVDEEKVNTVVNDVEKNVDKLLKQTEIVQQKIDNVSVRQHNETSKKGEVQDIPVKIVAEEPKPETDKKEENSNDYVPAVDAVTPEIKREEVDLKNPGKPQRQEHDSQSPDVLQPEPIIITKIKQNVLEAQNTFKQGLQGVSQNIQNWIDNNEQLQTIQENIQNLQESFNDQIQRLNSTVQGFFRPQSQDDNDDIFQDRKSVENQVVKTINGIDQTFSTGIQGINFGVEVLASVKEMESGDEPQLKQNQVEPASTSGGSGSTPGSSTAGESSGTGSASGTGGSQPPSTQVPGLGQLFQTFQQAVLTGFQNVTSIFQFGGSSNGGGLPNQSANGQSPAGAQSDDATTQRPSIWQGIQSQFSNIFRPNQQSQATPGQTTPSTPTGPFAQVISSNPIVQNINNFFRPSSSTEKPTETLPEGTNTVPEKPAEGSPQTPESSQTAGPIQTAIQRNPIVQGIAGAVQRIQSTMTNPETPREVEKDLTRGHGSNSNNANTVPDISSGIASQGDTIEKPEDVKKPCDKKPEDLQPIDDVKLS